MKSNPINLMIKSYLTFFFLLPWMLSAQITYFPPTTNNTWETLTWEEIGACTDSLDALLSYLDQQDSKAFILMKNGKIVLEHYFDSFTQDSLWFWASAGKTLTSYLVGIAEQEGSLSLTDPSSNYLGAGWTLGPSAQENAVTIQHQLSMSTGLDDAVVNPDCTDPACLTFLDDPGQRWAYHNAPYSLLDEVIHQATGLTSNAFFTSRIGSVTGMAGAYVNTDTYNHVFFSKPRTMARFSLLLANKGTWDGTPVVNLNYHQAMTHPSQGLNESYGYLTWLNGQPSFMLPQSQWVFQGMLSPNAPEECYAALGKYGQVCSVHEPSGLTWIRMGNGSSDLVSIVIHDQVWKYLNMLLCSTQVEMLSSPNAVTVKNNGSCPTWSWSSPGTSWQLVDNSGRVVLTGIGMGAAAGIPAGSYILMWCSTGGRQAEKIHISE